MRLKIIKINLITYNKTRSLSVLNIIQDWKINVKLKPNVQFHLNESIIYVIKFGNLVKMHMSNYYLSNYFHIVELSDELSECN